MNPTIILIEPQLGENIGMVARAMLNFGITSLRLVSPQEAWPNDKARRAAVGADCILDAAQVHDNFEEAIGDITHLYATSAMPRYMVKPAFTIPQITSTFDESQKIAFVFGPERTGLTNEYIARCQGVVRFPTNPEFSSLNLAQAVLLCVYEWAKASPQYNEPKVVDQKWASQNDVSLFLETLKNMLDQAHFFYPDHKRPLMWQNLSNIFTRMQLSEQEIRTLRGVLSSFKR